MTLRRHVIFGTAGHVDHGKSALVLALTGTDPDRLAEEKAREMTIDLGFAFLSLPGFQDAVAIVDVPGHEMFVRNMVAGATGIDAAIFVVAADEGVMPQTVEHLDVLRYLNLPAGVIALTKTDKVTAERLAEATDEVRNLVAGTFLERAPVVPVSSVTLEGLPKFREELAAIGGNVKTHPATGAFRQPIDRVFTLKGVGTVITGTVISGTLKAGETVTCLPQGLALRARSLHVHDTPVQQIFAGQRAAINLTDVAKQGLHRGDVLTTPGSLESTLMLDARLTCATKAPRPIAQRTRVRVHHGTKEVMARAVLLEEDTLERGQSALVQLRLESPLVALAGDLFVIRSYSPMRVIGGGTIVDAHPPKRRKAAGAVEVAKMEAQPTDELIVEALDRAGARGITFDRLRVLRGLTEADLRSILGELSTNHRAYAGRRNYWYSAGTVEDTQSDVTEHLVRLHHEKPLHTFIQLNALLSAVAPAPDQRDCFRLAIEVLAGRGSVVMRGERLRLATHKPQWTGRHAEAREKILAKLLESGPAAPLPKELARLASLNEKECRRVIEALIDAGELRLLAKGIVIHPDVFDRCRAKVLDYLARNGKMTIGQCRELLAASRKYLLPFLEALDREGLTLRQGDYRVLR